jgi:hypothetical protein
MFDSTHVPTTLRERVSMELHDEIITLDYTG